MGQQIQLTAADGFRLSAYRADPPQAPRGGLVVIQEIFGVNAHIREVADQYASAGYLAIAPAMFDRAQRGIELAYDPPGINRGIELVNQLAPDQMLLDLRAAIDAAAAAGKVGAVGYCWGGSIAYFAAAHTRIAAAVSYYGGRTLQFLNDKPKCPVMYHFAGLDKMIPDAMIDQIRAAHPAGIFHIYKEADHGFNCSHRASYEPASAALALERSLAFFREHVG
jgi:carboxymethylenebutenolidase